MATRGPQGPGWRGHRALWLGRPRRALRLGRPRRALLAEVVACGILVAGCGGTTVSIASVSPTTTPGATVATQRSPVGRILATGSGRTLYDFAVDTAGHSKCVSSTCVLLWPPLLAKGAVTVAHGARESLVGTIRRPDGTRQVTYAGHPLYTWSGDRQPGMVTGQALNNEGGPWYVLAPSGTPITTAFSVFG